MLVDNAIGAAGARVVIEDFLEGEEASFIVMVDGRHVLPLATSRITSACSMPTADPIPVAWAHTRPPLLTPALHARTCARSSARGARHGRGRQPYTGFLYAGLMIDSAGQLKTLEFNCRMGDPETQPIMMRLKSDLVDLVEHAVDGTLDPAKRSGTARGARCGDGGGRLSR